MLWCPGKGSRLPTGTQFQSLNNWISKWVGLNLCMVCLTGVDPTHFDYDCCRYWPYYFVDKASQLTVAWDSSLHLVTLMKPGINTSCTRGSSNNPFSDSLIANHFYMNLPPPPPVHTRTHTGPSVFLRPHYTWAARPSNGSDISTPSWNRLTWSWTPDAGMINLACVD